MPAKLVARAFQFMPVRINYFINCFINCIVQANSRILRYNGNTLMQLNTMSALLFKLRNVPDDEADDIRDLMQKHGIDIYETGAGNWGISMPSIWVQNDSNLAEAKQLIAQYQQARATNARKAYDEDRRLGRAPGIIEKIAERPFAIAGIVLFCLFVIYAMTSPFIRLAMTR